MKNRFKSKLKKKSSASAEPRKRRSIKHVIRRKKPTINSEAPRITNETVAAHRDEVLSSARKYITPLQQSKHRIVVVSTTLFIVTLVFFVTYCTLSLYKLQTNSTFLYRVTQVVPFPIARIGGDFVAYENYLFELRRYVHYYNTQVKIDFKDPRYKDQLVDFRRRAAEKVVNDAYIKELAKTHSVTVSDREVNDQVELLRAQNRLGNTNQVFEDVLKDYFGWTVDDFKRSIRQDLLAEKLVAKLDTETKARADAALNELKGGADFTTVAKKYSDDAATKENGGDLGVVVDRTSRDLGPQATDALFKLKPGEYSGIINVGSSLEIIKSLEVNGEKARAAHIVFSFNDVNQYLNDVKDKRKAKYYIKLPEAKQETAPQK